MIRSPNQLNIELGVEVYHLCFVEAPVDNRVEPSLRTGIGK